MFSRLSRCATVPAARAAAPISGVRSSQVTRSLPLHWVSSACLGRGSMTFVTVCLSCNLSLPGTPSFFVAISDPARVGPVRASPRPPTISAAAETLVADRPRHGLAAISAGAIVVAHLMICAAGAPQALSSPLDTRDEVAHAPTMGNSNSFHEDQSATYPGDVQAAGRRRAKMYVGFG